MVRILKVKELEERKQHLLTQSEMYRQTLTLEIANIKFSTALLKRKLRTPKVILTALGLTALPAAGFFFGRSSIKPKKKQQREQEGLLPKLMIGWNLFRRFAPLVQKFRQRHKQPRFRRQNLTHYP
jgi:Tfp pilus assembly protein PilN